MPATSTDDKKIYDIITERGKEFKPIFDRMDIDKGLFFGEAYKMMRPDDTKKPMDNVVNVTLNDATTFAQRAIATLGGTKRQVVVEGRDLSPKKASLIERFIEDLTYTIDEYLISQDGIGLDDFINEQLCVRGRIAARPTFYIDKKTGKIVPDVYMPDTRFFVYEQGVGGMSWGASISWRTRQLVKEQYGYEPIDLDGSQYVSRNEKFEVVDWYNASRNIVFIDDGKFTYNQANPFNETVYVHVKCPAGSQFSDTDAFQHEGESIFWQNRNLFPELNRLASIFQTLNVGSFAGAVQYESSAGTRAKKPKKPPWGIYSATPVEKGMGYKPMPANDIRQAARLFYSILYTRIQQGGLSSIDYGNLTFPLSAVAITRLTSSRDQIFLPRLEAKARFYREFYKKIIRQLIYWGKTVKLGKIGFTNEYKPEDLDGEYQISFRFLSESKEQDIANIETAISVKGTLSDETIRETILKVQDPQKETERLANEQLEANDKAIFLYNRCKAMINQGNNTAAWIAYSSLRDVLRQRRLASMFSQAQYLQATSAAAGQEETKQLPQGRQTMPLLGQGNAGGTVAPEVGEEEAALNKIDMQAEKEAEKGSRATQEVAQTK